VKTRLTAALENFRQSYWILPMLMGAAAGTRQYAYLVRACGSRP
jgi:hypothetical protein